MPVIRGSSVNVSRISIACMTTYKGNRFVCPWDLWPWDLCPWVFRSGLLRRSTFWGYLDSAHESPYFGEVKKEIAGEPTGFNEDINIKTFFL